MVFKDGPAALDTLQEAALTGEPWPAVILLDIEMPVFNGCDFLDYLASSLIWSSRPSPAGACKE